MIGTSKPVEINQDTWDKLLDTYGGNSADIDAFVGGLAEDAPEDALVGPLFSCIILEQFKKLMLGDRYFFTHSNQNNARGLKQNTKKAVLERTLAHIICDNTAVVDKIQENVFKAHDESSNENVHCADVPEMNFSQIVQEIIGKLKIISGICHAPSPTQLALLLLQYFSNPS